MATVLSRASQVYTPRTIVLSPNVPAKVKRLVFSFTRESWPLGEVATIDMTYPDGSPCLSVGFGGGIAIDRGTGLPKAASSFGIGTEGADTLPAGVYGVTITIKQEIRTAVTVDAA